MHRIGKKLKYFFTVTVCLLLLSGLALAEESFAVPDERTGIADASVTREAQEPISETQNEEEPSTVPEGEPEAPEPEEDTLPDESSENEPTAEDALELPEAGEFEDTAALEGPDEDPYLPDASADTEEPEMTTVPEETYEPAEEFAPALLSCGETLFWQVSADGTELMFSGSGMMYSFETPSNVPWADWKETITVIVLPEGISGIGAYAFSGFSALRSIILPASIESIGAHAFENCVRLETITFSGEFPVVGADAFAGDTVKIGFPVNCLSWTHVSATDLGDGVMLQHIIEEPDEPEKPDEPENMPFVPEITLNKEYVHLDPGEQYSLVAKPNFEAEELVWTVMGEAVSLSEGIVTAEEQGIAYITVSAEFEGSIYTAVCCVEVARSTPVKTGISEIRLITAVATVEVYQTDYAHIRIFPVLEVSISPHSKMEDTDMSGATVEKAVFTNSALNEFFTIRVVDNETLEIVPTPAAIAAADSHSRDMKGTYVTGITVTAGGKEYTPYESIKIRVKRSRPSVKAEPIVFNSYPTELGISVPFKFTGGRVTSCRLLNEAPSWLEFDPYRMTAALSPTYVPDKYSGGKLILSCEVEGWSVPATVTVRYSGKCFAPKLAFSEKNVTLFAGTGDTARIHVKLSPDVYADPKKYPITLAGIEQKTETGYTPIENGTLLHAVFDNGVLTVSAPEPAKDGKEHIYRLILTAVGKEFSCVVRVPAPGIVPKPSLKTSGNIDPSVPGSMFVITPSLKNYHSDSVEIYTLCSIEQYKGKTLVNANVLDMFTVTEDGGRFLIRERTSGSVPGGYTYRAVITLKTSMGEADASVSIKISTAQRADMVRVSIRSEGGILLTDPDSCIVITPSVRPRKKEEELVLIFFRKKDGKAKRISPEECPFTVKENKDGTFILQANEMLEPGVLYYAQLQVTLDGKTYASKTVKLPVKH